MRKITLLAATLMAASPALVLAETTAHLNDEAKILIKQFASSLQGELVSAIKAGGPVNAIGVCQEKAPAIANSLSESSDWTIGRTSLKTRNPNNAPDAWETRILKQFESLKAAGNPVSQLSYAEVTEDGGQKQYRYMKAIPTQEVCLTCHGKEIDPALADAIDQAYPQDQARGYSAGDIRGAFTLSQPL
jgi:cytochrome c553